jgi:hypothetical protein
MEAFHEINTWVHLLSTWFMVGLVGFVQWIHYPLLTDLPPEAVPAYELAHMRRTFPLIPLVMLLEAGSGIALVGSSISWWVWWLNLFLMILIWGVTFIFILPVHERLAVRFSFEDYQRLLRRNRLRTLLWLGHGFLVAIWMGTRPL